MASQGSQDSLGDEDERLALAIEISMIDKNCADADEMVRALVQSQREEQQRNRLGSPDQATMTAAAASGGLLSAKTEVFYRKRSHRGSGAGPSKAGRVLSGMASPKTTLFLDVDDEYIGEGCRGDPVDLEPEPSPGDDGGDAAPAPAPPAAGGSTADSSAIASVQGWPGTSVGF